VLLLGASPPVVYWSVTMTRGAGEAVCGAVSGLEWSGSGASERTPGAPPPRAGWGGCFWCLLGAWPAQAVMSGVGARRGRRERGERASKESPFRLLPPPAAAQANKPTTPARLPPRTRARGGGVPAVASASVSSDGRTHARWLESVTAAWIALDLDGHAHGHGRRDPGSSLSLFAPPGTNAACRGIWRIFVGTAWRHRRGVWSGAVVEPWRWWPLCTPRVPARAL
jgi:hypothetical protein